MTLASTVLNLTTLSLLLPCMHKSVACIVLGLAMYLRYSVLGYYAQKKIVIEKDIKDYVLPYRCLWI